MTSDSQALPRPSLFRALGEAEPPPVVTCGGRDYIRERLLKHDSWAASAVYSGSAGRIMVKFNRVAPIFGLPMTWLGNWLAEREAWMLRELADQRAIPPWSGDVLVEGHLARNAVAHDWIEGHPLCSDEVVGDAFFAELRELVLEMHRRGIAYVDLHKQENIIVGEDGRPYLIDFQVSQALPQWWLVRLVTGPMMWMLQQTDLYNLRKHEDRHQADPYARWSDLSPVRPWWIDLHRAIAMPLRSLRRWLLVALGIRTGDGHAASEAFPEDAIRAESEFAGSK